LVEASEQATVEGLWRVDLTENGFDDLFAQAIAAASRGALKLERQGSNARAAKPSAFAAGVGLAVPRSARSDECINAAVGQMEKIVVRADPASAVGSPELVRRPARAAISR